MSKLAYGLNITKKPQLGQRPPPAKRKTIFDDDSEPEDDAGDVDPDPSESINTLGGLQSPTKSASTSSGKVRPSTALPPSKQKPPQISPFGSLSSTLTSSKHSKAAADIDPSIYDYDAFVSSTEHNSDSVPDAAAASSDTATHGAPTAQKPKYMTSLLAAASTRKRDQLRAKEKLLAREREEEGDAFAGKEAFVTGAYKRQMEEARRAEEEERKREEEDRRRGERDGGGMTGFYRDMLGREEERHKRFVQMGEKTKKDKEEEGKDMDGELGKGEQGEESFKKNRRSEADLAKEKGAVVNEDGEVVDKRQLLTAGLNAGAQGAGANGGGSRAKAADPREMKRKRPAAREEASRGFEEMLLARSGGDDEGEDRGEDRAAKSRRMEDELLARMGG